MTNPTSFAQNEEKEKIIMDNGSTTENLSPPQHIQPGTPEAREAVAKAIFALAPQSDTGNTLRQQTTRSIKKTSEIPDLTTQKTIVKRLIAGLGGRQPIEMADEDMLQKMQNAIKTIYDNPEMTDSFQTDLQAAAEGPTEDAKNLAYGRVQKTLQRALGSNLYQRVFGDSQTPQEPSDLGKKL